VPGKDAVEIFTTRWAMSYLRGPMTRDQIARLMAEHPTAATTAASAVADAATATPSTAVSGTTSDLSSDETPVMPEVADDVPVRWVDVAAPWLAEVGGSASGTRLEAAIVARVRLRYDDTKADLIHDEDYECVLAPLTDPVDVSRALAVDYDDRDLRTDAPADAVYRLSPLALTKKTLFSGIERDLRDHLTRTLTIEVPANADLKLYGRPGETTEAFETRCLQAADDRADTEIAALRDKYEAKATKLRDAIAAAEDRVDVLEAQAEGKRNSELLSTAGSILGGLLGGRKRNVLGKLGTAARSRGTTKAAQERVGAAESKVARLVTDLEELESELAEEITEIDARWMGLAKRIEPMSIGLERSDVAVVQLSLAWLPVD
jgi:hypothetical protein